MLRFFLTIWFKPNLEGLAARAALVDAASRPKPRTGDQDVNQFQNLAMGLGGEHDSGLNVSHYLPGMAHKLVMMDLGEGPSAKGDGKAVGPGCGAALQSQAGGGRFVAGQS